MKPFNNASMMWGIVLILLQVADAICTYIGVVNFGPDVEGDPFIKYLIGEFGPAVALTSVKCVASIFVIFMAILQAERLLIFLSGLYSGVVLIWVLSLIHALS